MSLATLRCHRRPQPRSGKVQFGRTCPRGLPSARPLPGQFRNVSLIVWAKVDTNVQSTDHFQDELEELAENIDEVAKSADEGLQGTSIFLVGMMGSGKSTVGRMLCNVLKYCFFDSDRVIEQAVGGASVADIFRENGEEGFRDMERSVLQELSAYKNCVIATGGGVVCRPENWGSMQVGVTVYLEGPPELLAKRVLAQDGAASRPLLAPSDTAEALEEEETVERLRNLLKERDTSYRNADCIVSLAGDGEYGASAPQMLLRVLMAIDQRIKSDAKEREDRKKFNIKQTALKAEA